MDKRIISLFEKYVNEQCSLQELEEVLTILKSGRHQSEWEQVIAAEAERVLASDLQSELSPMEVDGIYAGIAAQLPLAKRKAVRLWSRISIAAAIFMMFGAGLYFYKSNLSTLDPVQGLSSKNDIPSGKNGATLTLSNGKKIILGDVANGKIVNDNGLIISKSKDNEVVYEVSSTNASKHGINTMSTTNGQTFAVILPDKSKVWLNAASSIKYPASFAGDPQGLRKVELTGEAYFEISKDKVHPFIVKALNQEVRVLGTHFNINSYSDEPYVKTTLLEGSVNISSGHALRILMPGQQALNNNRGIRVVNVETDNVIDWKNGDFVLNGIDFKTAMRKISRWYDVEIIFDGDLPGNIEIGGWIPRNYNISAVLKLIASTNQVHFKVEGRRITVIK